VIPALSSTDVAVVRAIGGFLGQNGAVTGGLVARTALRVALTAATDSSMSVLQQIADNAVAGKPLNDDLGTAAWQGIAYGPTPVLSMFLLLQYMPSLLRPLGGFESLGMLRKISKSGKWNTVGKLVKAGKKTLGPKIGRNISKFLQYPLKHSEGALRMRARPSSSFASTISSVTKAIPDVASEFISNLSHSDVRSAQRFLHAQNIPGL
jgi:hypothetical protein